MTRQPAPSHENKLTHERWILLRHISEFLDQPLVFLSLAWIFLIFYELVHGLNRPLEIISYFIWALFLLDFLIELLIAPNRKSYLKQNWITAVSVLLPALGLLRMLRVFKLLQSARALRSLSLLRTITSFNRGMNAISRTISRRGIHYVLILTIIITLTGAAGMAKFENQTALSEAGIKPLDYGYGIHNYSDALWWTAMLMTSIGTDYGPRTMEGRILAFFLALYALAVFGYITAAIASHFIGVDVGSNKNDD